MFLKFSRKLDKAFLPKSVTFQEPYSKEMPQAGEL